MNAVAFSAATQVDPGPAPSSPASGFVQALGDAQSGIPPGSSPPPAGTKAVEEVANPGPIAQSQKPDFPPLIQLVPVFLLSASGEQQTPADVTPIEGGSKSDSGPLDSAKGRPAKGGPATNLDAAAILSLSLGAQQLQFPTVVQIGEAPGAAPPPVQTNAESIGSVSPTSVLSTDVTSLLHEGQEAFSPTGIPIDPSLDNPLAEMRATVSIATAVSIPVATRAATVTSSVGSDRGFDSTNPAGTTSHPQSTAATGDLKLDPAPGIAPDRTDPTIQVASAAVGSSTPDKAFLNANSLGGDPRVAIQLTGAPRLQLSAKLAQGSTPQVQEQAPAAEIPNIAGTPVTVREVDLPSTVGPAQEQPAGLPSTSPSMTSQTKQSTKSPPKAASASDPIDSFEDELSGPDVEKVEAKGASVDSDSSGSSATKLDPRAFQAVVQPPESSTVAGPAAPIPLKAGEINLVVKQIADRIQLMTAAQPKNGITIQLQPENLGSITLTVKALAGAVQAHISASSDSVRMALEQNRPMLGQAMADRGFKLEAVSIATQLHSSTTSQRQSAQQQQGQGNRPNSPKGFSPQPQLSESAQPRHGAFASRKADGVDIWI